MLETRELRELWYANWNTIAIFVLIIFNFLRINKKKNIMSDLSLAFSDKMVSLGEKKRIFKPFGNIIFLAIIECGVFTFFQYSLPSNFIVLFGQWFNTGYNYFGLVFSAPIILFAFCSIIWVNPLKKIDHLTTAYPVTLAVTKIACACAGCCHGMDWNYGIMNYKWERCEVPIQIIECVVAFLIFIFMFFYEKKAKPGMLYPVFTILYSGTRFFTEFLRGEPNIVGPLKKYHFFCLMGVIYGLLMLVIVHFLGDKITHLFEQTTYFKKGKFHESVIIKRTEIRCAKDLKEKEKKKNSYNKSKNSRFKQKLKK